MKLITSFDGELGARRKFRCSAIKLPDVAIRYLLGSDRSIVISNIEL